MEKVKLVADSILIMRNGSLLVGNPDWRCIYKRDTEIVLTGRGRETPDTTFGYYTKGIYVSEGGNLDLHGRDKLSWTKLADTVKPSGNKNKIYEIKLVDEPLGWEAGDNLVIASTDFDMYQAEEVEVINCTTPCEEFIYCKCFVKAIKGTLEFTHYGKIYKVFLVVISHY